MNTSWFGQGFGRRAGTAGLALAALGLVLAGPAEPAGPVPAMSSPGWGRSR